MRFCIYTFPLTSPPPFPLSAPLTPRQELQAFIREHGLPEAKLETVSFRPKSKSAGRVPSFYSTITVRREWRRRNYGPQKSLRVSCHAVTLCCVVFVVKTPFSGLT